MRKRLEAFAVALALAALLFLVFRDLSGNVRFSIGVPSFAADNSPRTEDPAARAAVERWCEGNPDGRCLAPPTYLGGAPETTNWYQVEVYVVAIADPKQAETAYVLKIVIMEGGQVVGIK